MFEFGSLIIVEVSIALTALVVAYIQWSHQYWKRRNFPYLESSFPLGHSQNPFRMQRSVGQHVESFYRRIKNNGWRYGGIYFYTTRVLYVIDPELLKHIMAADFQYFTDRGMYYNEKDDPLSAHLVVVNGPKWRKLRTKLTPAFTSGKMKIMFQTLVAGQDALIEAVDGYCERREALDIKELFARFTTNFIANCAFGLECNTFKDENSPFRVYGKKIFERNLVRLAVFLFSRSYPNLSRSLGIRQLPKDVTDFFMTMVSDTVDYRERNGVIRNDFLQMLMDLKNRSQTEEGCLTMNELAAQCMGFFAAGFETSSTTMTFAMYELANDQDIQDKVRKEIAKVEAKHDGPLTYDDINSMKYLQQVLDETLRRYPPAPFITRICVKDYKIPGDDLVVEKGVTMLIPVMGLHSDPDLYPDPDKFDPERFNDENKANIRPCTYIPFGEGPRNCIGLRFGLMQAKVGLIALIKNYKFTVNNRTKQPLRMAPYAVIQSADGDVWLDVEKITE